MSYLQKLPSQPLKYLASGCIGLSVNLGMFWLLLHALHYLQASTVALAISTVVGFILQKYWTFEDRAHHRAPIQFVLYGSVTLGNLTVNAVVVYLLTGVFGVMPLISQTVGAGIVALSSYFIYRHLIFVSWSSGVGREPRLY